MTSKPICMATWRYKRPDKNGHRGLKATLKYVTFREDANHVVPADGRERWIDGGLGGSWREVYAHSQQLAGPYVLAHHFVIAPNPDLMALVPEAQRRALVQELTTNTLIDWHQARDLPVPEMSFVIHDRETTDATAPGRQMLHSHVFTAGTLPTLEGRQSVLVREREVVRNKGGLDRPTNLNHIAEQNLTHLLDRTLGLDWRQVITPDPDLTLDIQHRALPESNLAKAIDLPLLEDDPFELRPRLARDRELDL